MQDKKRITLFMLVTNRDCIIADYAIKSYQKIYDQKKTFGYQDFVLFVYLNCLSEENKNQYLHKWKSYPYTTVFDNAEKFEGAPTPYPGMKIVSPEGFQISCDDYAESYDELWSNELKKFQTPFIATVDADFEVLNADFYFYLLDQLKANPDLIAASSCHAETTYLYESYSKRNILLSERNHTWFCIYKKEAFLASKVSHFYYEMLTNEGQTLAFDSAAYFQHDLRTNHNYTLTTLPKEFNSSFVHYGATSKNKSLNRKNIGYYRMAFLLSVKGLVHGRETNGIIKLINKVVRKIAGRLFSSYLNRKAVERSVHVWEKADAI